MNSKLKALGSIKIAKVTIITIIIVFSIIIIIIIISITILSNLQLYHGLKERPSYCVSNIPYNPQTIAFMGHGFVSVVIQWSVIPLEFFKTLHMVLC